MNLITFMKRHKPLISTLSSKDMPPGANGYCDLWYVSAGDMPGNGLRFFLLHVLEGILHSHLSI